jgi:DNA-damage-inducible protein J
MYYYIRGRMMSVAVKETTSIKLDKQTKENAKLIFKELGITMSDAMNMFLSQVNLHQGLPFDVKIPNKLTKKVIEESHQGINVDNFSLDELL